jgi:hypothetical protein
MKKYFSGLCVAGLFLCSTLAMPTGYTQDTQKHRNHKSSKDTMSDTRMRKSTQPRMNKTDSLPVPDPQRVPMPDSIPMK